MTSYPSRPVPALSSSKGTLTSTLTRLAGVGVIIMGIAFCVVMIATTPAHARATYRADWYDAVTHREHTTELREWESRYARGETWQIVSALTVRAFNDFPTHRARVRYVLSLADEAKALEELTYERQDAIAAGFCDTVEAEESSAFEALESLREAASLLHTEAVSLGVEFNTPLSRKARRRLEKGEIERFFKAASTLVGKDQRAMLIVDAFYQVFTTPEIENESCRGIYGTDAFEAEREQVFYTPTFGWPLPPKEE